ncbi:MAG TPA: HRDC domain-containing protein [Gemmatimonadaceae bacterium]
MSASPSSNGPQYIDSPEAANRFLASIANARALALDTEGASFHRYVDRIYLLQLSTEQQHAIIDPLRVDSPTGLGRLLESRQVEIVFHDADYDLRLLHQDYAWRVTNIFDTRVAAQLLGIRAFGLAALLESFFGVRLDKKHQRADWSMRPLPGDMLEYAAQDTMHLLPLRERLRDALERKGRLHWAQEEFERLEGTQWDDTEEDMSFLRIKGARDITRRELAVLRELVSWRDSVARELDRSTFRVAGNDVLLAIARESPTTVAAVESTRGLSRSVVARHARAIVDAVQRGKAVPESELPRFPRGPRWARDPDYEDRVAALKTVRDRRSAELELEPGVLCPRERLEAIARRNPRSLDELMEVPDVRKWQVESLGDEFVAVLQNRTGQAPKSRSA